MRSTQCQPGAVPRAGRDPPHILGRDAQNTRPWGAGCGGRVPTLCPWSWGLPQCRGCSQTGVLGDKEVAWGGFAPCHGRSPAPRTVSGSGGRGSAGRGAASPMSPPISRRGAPAGFGVPIWDAAVAVRCWWGARGPRSYFGVFSPARIPPTGGAAVALCRSWVIFRAPAYILALSQSGWVAPPGTGERGPLWPDRGTAVAMWLHAEGGVLVLWEAASLPLGRVFPPWMGSWAFWGAVLPPSAACSLAPLPVSYLGVVVGVSRARVHPGAQASWLPAHG